MRNSLLLFLIALSQVLNAQFVNADRLEEKDKVWYVIDEDVPFTGIAVSGSASGKLLMEANYVNGKLNGKSVTYNDNGKIQTIEEFKDGVFNGKVQHFYTNGNLSAIRTYEND